MSRRTAALSAIVTTVALGGLVPSLLTGASAAACPAWTDPKGDSSTAQAPNPTGLIGDANLDIVAASFVTSATDVIATIKSDKLNETASDAGDRFDVEFTVAGKNLRLYADRAGTVGVGIGPSATAPVGADVGIYNITSSTKFSGKAKVAYDVKASTVTITATVADLAAAAGVAVAGNPVSGLVANTQDYFTGASVGFGYDDAATTATATLGVSCGSGSGSGTPTPTSSATPAPTASPTPTPTPTATPGQTPPPSSGGADPMKDFPLPGCATVTDPKDDGKIAGNGSNDPDLDITALTLRTTATDLLAYVNVDKLAAGPASTDGQRYAVDFTFNKHVFSLSASTSAHGSTALRDVAANSGLVGHVIQLGVDAPSTTAVPPPTDRGLKASGLKANFDLTGSRVVFDLPIADIVKYGGAPFTGPITAVDAKSQVETNILSLGADTAGGTTTWTVGDNKCFTQKTALKLGVIKKGVSRTVTAMLTAGGKGLPKQLLTVSVNGKKVGTITTDASGKAAYTRAKPNQTVKISFLGSPGYEASSATTKV